ncbi:MAG: transposase [Chitinispirillales bacterium]|nr:transposase [Chitinispirillales bacterium]
MARNYEKDLYNHNQELIKENERLKAKAAKIETETANKYLGIIDRLNETIETVLEKCGALEERVLKLETENERMRKQLNNDSSNSSKPPSSDDKPNAPNTYNGRTKSGKKSGGQTGHKGNRLNRVVIEEKISSGQMKREIVNHGMPVGNYVSKYVIDVKLETFAIEHRFYDNADIPKELRPEVQYGTGIKSFVATLAGQGLVSSSRIVDMLSAWTNGAIELSDGTIYNFLSEFNGKSAAFIENTKSKLLNNTIMNVDETGARVNGRNMFFRNYSGTKHVLYTANQTKGKKAIEDDNILPQYVGILIHDHNTVNYNYGGGNSECNVHLIRYLKANSDNTHHLWSEDMIEFLLSLKRSRELAIAFGAKSFEQADSEGYLKRYDEIVSAGFEVNKDTKSRFYRDEERKLLKRLKKYRDNHLLFAVNFTVPFDNNLSERDLRMVKAKQKVSGCFRSLGGAKVFANLMSVIKTALKQNISPFSAVTSVFNQNCCLQ